MANIIGIVESSCVVRPHGAETWSYNAANGKFVGVVHHYKGGRFRSVASSLIMSEEFGEKKDAVFWLQEVSQPPRIEKLKDDDSADDFYEED